MINTLEALKYSNEEHHLWYWFSWVWILADGSVLLGLGKVTYIFWVSSPLLLKGDNKNIYLIELLQGVNDVIVKQVDTMWHTVSVM